MDTAASVNPMKVAPASPRMTQEAQARPSQSRQQQGRRASRGELRTEREQTHGGDEAQPADIAVDAVEQIHGVRDANHPEQRQQHVAPRGQPSDVDTNPVDDEQPRAQQLHDDAKDARQFELIVDEPDEHQNRPAEHDGQELNVDARENRGFQDHRQHQRGEHPREDRQPADVRQEFLVQPPLVRLVTQAFLHGEITHSRNEEPRHEHPREKEHHHRHDARLETAGNADHAQEIAHDSTPCLEFGASNRTRKEKALTFTPKSYRSA
jgi:hypothetical protein